MSDIHSPLKVFAPAKVNLFLHIVGKMPNGYHALESLVTFADVGDDIVISPAQDLRFSIEGPFANAFSHAERTQAPDSQNIVVRAVREFSKRADQKPDLGLISQVHNKNENERTKSFVTQRQKNPQVAVGVKRFQKIELVSGEPKKSKLLDR